MTYPWKRFWGKSGNAFLFGPNGYLYDPEGPYTLNPDVLPLEEVIHRPCLALLGEPGIGKSSALEDERASIERAISATGERLKWIDLKEYGDEGRLLRDLFEDSEFESWLSGDHKLHVFLDSLDECRIHVPTVVSLLSRKLREHEDQISRLQFRIACRTADWPRSLQEVCEKLWGKESVGVFELAPLIRRDVVVAAQAEGLDADAFTEAIAQRSAQPLASKPITLQMLMGIFKRDGRLPSTQKEVYEQGLAQLCRELSPSRKDSGEQRAIGDLSAQKRFVIASRVAATVVFGGKAAVFTGLGEWETSPEDVPVSELVEGQESAYNTAFVIDERSVQEVLKTGLFNGRGSQRLGFAHQTYAEFLAARYAVARSLDLTQKLSLVTSSVEGRVVPQLSETAAWMAGMDVEVFDALLERDPQVLHRSDVARLDAPSKSRYVATLLKMTEEAKANDFELGSRRLYSELRHPSLAAQLEPYIRDRGKNQVVRRVAIDIAESCRITSLQGALADVALDDSEDAHVRSLAVRALIRVGDPDVRARLKPLMWTTEAEDPDDEIRGRVLKCLWPDVISAEDLFKNLNRPRKGTWRGAYKAFYWFDVHTHLRVEDLPVALNWVKDNFDPRSEPFGPHALMLKILARAAHHLDAPEIFDAFVNTLASTVLKEGSAYVLSGGSLDEGEDLVAVLTEKGAKRKLVEAFVLSVLGKDDLRKLYYNLPLVGVGDLPWLVGKALDAQAADEAEKWVALTLLVFNVGEPGHADLIISAAPKSPVLREKFAGWLEPVDLNSPEAEKRRETRARRKQIHQQRGTPLVDPTPAERVRQWLDMFEGGNFDAWWNLVLDMTLEPTSTHYGDEYNADLTSLPGWKSASPETKRRILEAAKSYVAKRDAAPSEWLERDPPVNHRPATAGYKALLLLRSQDSDFVGALPPSTWKRWAPIILGYPSPGRQSDEEEPQLDLIRRAYEHAPEEVIETVSVLVNRGGHGEPFELHKVLHCWDERLCDVLREKVKDPKLKPHVFRNLLRALMTRGCDDAVAYAQSLLSQTPPPDSEKRARLHAAAVMLLLHTGDASWSFVWPVLQRDAAFAREVFEDLATSFPISDTPLLAPRLTEAQVADLYIWLEWQYPQADDPRNQKRDAFREITSRDDVADFRDRLLRDLQERGTSAAIQAIDCISHELPHLDWLKWTRLEAETQRCRNDWEPLTPAQLRELVTRKGSRLVRSADELQEAVIESLRRLDQKLQGETPAAPQLWDQLEPNVFKPKDENHLSDYIKLHLEEDLKRSGIIALREVEIRRRQGRGVGSPGERTDLHVMGTVEEAGGAYRNVRIIVEVKGCWDGGLKKSMREQLVERYLKDNECRHGLYVVGWYVCDQWNAEDDRRKNTPSWTLDQARGFFDDQAASLSVDGLRIKSFVLNAALR